MKPLLTIGLPAYNNAPPLEAAVRVRLRSPVHGKKSRNLQPGQGP